MKPKYLVLIRHVFKCVSVEIRNITWQDKVASKIRFELEHSRLLAGADILLIDPFDLSINRTKINTIKIKLQDLYIYEKNAASFSITKENYYNIYLYTNIFTSRTNEIISLP